jgi:phage terminase large subunit GpA-like protein
MVAPAVGFRRGAELLAVVAAAIRPPRKASIAEAARLHRRFKVPGGGFKRWDADSFPPMTEVMGWFESRDVTAIYIMGPSQFGKSELMLNVSAHALLYDPADILIVQPTETAAAAFVAQKLDRMLDASVDADGQPLRRLLATGRKADTATTKTARSGMVIDVTWPTENNLSARTVKFGLCDERDRMTDDVGGSARHKGEGDPVRMLRQRIKAYGRDGKLLVACSPSRTDGTGIVALVRGVPTWLVAVQCDGCADYFTPGYDPAGRPTDAHLRVASWDDPEAARAGACLVCPHCGHPHEKSERRRLLAGARLLPPGCELLPDGTMRGEVPAGRDRAVAFHGLVNPQECWGDIAAAIVAAEREFQATGNENALRTVANTVLGSPYVSKHAALPPLEVDDVRARRVDGFTMGLVPAGVRYLTASVDVQGNRFAVGVFGHDEYGSIWLVDRFDILTIDDRPISPPSRPEDWAILFSRVLEARYPLAERPAVSLGIATTAIDTGGAPGTDPAARHFWQWARARGWPEPYLTMVKGASAPGAVPLAKPTLEIGPDGRPVEGGYRKWLVGSHGLKDVLANRLRRAEAGPGSVYLPADLPESFMDEILAERKGDDGRWVKVRRANETLDLLVYAIAASMRIRPGRINWRVRELWPPWAAPMAAELAAVELRRVGVRRLGCGGDRPGGEAAPAGGSEPGPALVPAPKAEPMPAAVVRPVAQKQKPRPVRRSGGFVNGWR